VKFLILHEDKIFLHAKSRYIPRTIKLVKEISDLKEDWLDASLPKPPLLSSRKKNDVDRSGKKSPSIEEALQLFEKLA
jgi:hypothetical protein